MTDTPRHPEMLEQELPGFWYWFKERFPRFQAYGAPGGPPIGYTPGAEVDEAMAEALPEYVARLKERAGLGPAMKAEDLAGDYVKASRIHRIKAERQGDTLIELEGEAGPINLAVTPDVLSELLGGVIASLGFLSIPAESVRVRPYVDASKRYSVEFNVEGAGTLALACSEETARGLHVALYHAVGGTTRLLAPVKGG